MQRTAVDSDQIRSIGFDTTTKVMEIEFPRGSIYQYRGPKVEQHYAGLMQAASEGRSVGSYFNQNVRGCSFTEYTKGEFPPPGDAEPETDGED